MIYRTVLWAGHAAGMHPKSTREFQFGNLLKNSYLNLEDQEKIQG
jgi:hypothetical protein